MRSLTNFAYHRKQHENIYAMKSNKHSMNSTY
uniref:Uncharacterized protein n=1 Tax=Arundo donax TaxID=35708 RepID=A0A0A9CBB8_ARUDO